MSVSPTIDIPIRFPTARERLQRSIAAARSLSLLDRLRVVDGLLQAIKQLRESAQNNVDHGRLRRIRKGEVTRCFEEFIRSQLAGQPGSEDKAD